MYNLSANITIFSNKTWKFSLVNSVVIERDIDKITGTCKIVLPKKIKWDQETSIPIKMGDKVKVSLGYDNNLDEVFVGYIKRVSAKTPVVIECEDSMYLLKKRNTKKKSYSKATIGQILMEQIPPGLVKYKTYAKQDIGKYVVECETVAQLLGELLEFGITSFFHGDELKVGMIHDHTEYIGKKKQVLADDINIIDDSELHWYDAEEINLKIKATGTDNSGKKFSIEVGDPEGLLKEFGKFNTTKTQLKFEATQKLTEWKKSGLSGSLVTFGQKYIWLFDIVKIKQEGKDRGIYKVLKNSTTFSSEGYRQRITIGGFYD